MAESDATEKSEGGSLATMIISLFCLGLAFAAYYIYQTKDIRAAKQAIELRLKDPYSVKYSGLTKCPFGNGVTGDYNAKNSWGAYAGNEPFLYVNGDLATVEDDNFGELLDLCYHGKVRSQAERDRDFEEALGK